MMRDDETIEDHDRGLAHDLRVVAERMMARRRALGWLVSAAGGALVSGCGGGGDTASASDTGTTASTGTTSTTTSSTGTTTTGTTSSTGTTTATTGTQSTADCIVDPTETAGPYPADGTNNAQGSTSNILTQSGILRSDIRASFLGSTTVAAGVQLTFTITLVNARNSCAPLAGYAIYLWHCDRGGNYSLYSAPAESYLRGVQVTDANGQVTFTTIFPACYSGRYPHIHLEVFSSASAATSGRAALLTSQFAMPAAICSIVFASTGYTQSVSNFAQVSIASDNVFGDNSAAQIAQQTPTMTGSVDAGYTASAIVGISV